MLLLSLKELAGLFCLDEEDNILIPVLDFKKLLRRILVRWISIVENILDIVYLDLGMLCVS